MDLNAFIKEAKRELLTAGHKNQINVWAPVVSKAAASAARGYQRADGPAKTRAVAALRSGAMSVAPVDIQGAIARRSNQILHQNASRAKKMYHLTEVQLQKLIASRREKQ